MVCCRISFVYDEEKEMKLQYDSTQMRQKADEIRYYNSVLNENMHEIETVVLSLNSEWKGESQKAHSGRLCSMKNEYKRVASFFEEYARLLVEIAEKADSRDESISGRINAI